MLFNDYEHFFAYIISQVDWKKNLHCFLHAICLPDVNFIPMAFRKISFFLQIQIVTNNSNSILTNIKTNFYFYREITPNLSKATCCLVIFLTVLVIFEHYSFCKNLNHKISHNNEKKKCFKICEKITKFRLGIITVERLSADWKHLSIAELFRRLLYEDFWCDTKKSLNIGSKMKENIHRTFHCLFLVHCFNFSLVFEIWLEVYLFIWNQSFRCQLLLSSCIGNSAPHHINMRMMKIDTFSTFNFKLSNILLKYTKYWIRMWFN